MTIDQSIQGSDPNVGGNEDGGGGSDAGQGGSQAPVTSAGRTYTDADMASARKSWEYRAKVERDAAVSAVRQEYERRLAAGQTQAQAQAGAQAEAAKFDPTVESALKQWFQQNYGSTLESFREGQVRAEVNLGLSQFKSRHPELSEDQVNEVLQAATDFGDAVMNATPMDKLLDMAYLRFKYGNFDEKKFKDEAVQEYLKSKQKTAAVPRPQGPGGAVVGQKKAKDFGTADSIFESMLKDSDNT